MISRRVDLPLVLTQGNSAAMLGGVVWVKHFCMLAGMHMRTRILARMYTRKPTIRQLCHLFIYYINNNLIVRYIDDAHDADGLRESGIMTRNVRDVSSIHTLTYEGKRGPHKE